MISLTTTLSLMMAFNAIVFDGVSAQPDEVDPTTPNPNVANGVTVAAIDCESIKEKITSCNEKKWERRDRDDYYKCCQMRNRFCALNQLASKDCKGDSHVNVALDLTNSLVSSSCPDVGFKPDLSKCSSLETNPMNSSCDDVFHYINCNPKDLDINLKKRDCERTYGRIHSCNTKKWKHPDMDDDYLCCQSKNRLCAFEQLMATDDCKGDRDMARTIDIIKDKVKSNCGAAHQSKGRATDCSSLKFSNDSSCEDVMTYTDCLELRQLSSKSGGVWIIVLIVAIFLILVIIGLIWFFGTKFWGKNKNEVEEEKRMAASDEVSTPAEQPIERKLSVTSRSKMGETVEEVKSDEKIDSQPSDVSKRSEV